MEFRLSWPRLSQIFLEGKLWNSVLVRVKWTWTAALHFSNHELDKAKQEDSLITVCN